VRLETVVITNSVASEFTWGAIESADYKDYIARLRGVECPEQTIRDIITADVNKLFALKLKELRPNQGRLEYWQRPPDYYSKEERERQEKYRMLEKEKSALLTELLGEDTNKLKQKENGYVDHWDRMLSFLTDEKRSAAREVHDRFEQQLQKIYRGYIQDEEDQKEIRRIQRERLAAMSQVLTPEELERYELNTSQIASQLRYDLDGFSPNDKEFRDIFNLRKAREDDLAYAYDPEDKAAQDRRRKAVEDVDAQIKSMLGDARFEEYKRAQDYSYKELARLASRHELPAEVAVTVYDMKKVAEDAARKVREDRSLSTEQRKEALQAIRTETEASVAAQIGEKGMKSYQRSGGHWLNSLGR
jgi:hypothetical protein